MNIWEAILLGMVQGLTEFLPVSSSGHLALGKALLGIGEHGILFEVVVHLGTLLAVFTAFSSDIKWLLAGLVPVFRRRDPDNPPQGAADQQARRYMGLLLLATLPIVFIGLFFKEQVENAFDNPLLAAWLLLVTGGLLLLSRLGLHARGGVDAKKSVLIGLAQAFAILPGISRSGSTISIGMILGVEREEAARFSFLMAVPAIAGAFVLQMSNLPETEFSNQYLILLVTGFLVSYVSGFFAIKFLLAIVKRGRFDYFAWYCFAIGAMGIYHFS